MSNPFVELVSSYRTRTGSAFVHEHLVAALNKAKKAGLELTPEQLYVRTNIDDLIDDVISGRIDYRVIILTGDAGDGKTCVGERLSWKGAGRPLTNPVEDVKIAGEDWKFVKDASENQVAIPIVVQEALDGRYRLLVAANEGKLRSEASGLGDIWTQIIEPSLHDRHEDSDLQVLESTMQERRVLVINFRMRSEVENLTNGLLVSWTNPDYWENGFCRNCPKSDICPILANASDLRDERKRHNVVRLASWLELTGQRLPVRRLQGILAYMLTGGTSCRHVLDTPLNQETSLKRHRYWNAAFLKTDAEPAAAQLSHVNAESIASPSRDAELLQQAASSLEIPSARNEANLDSTSARWATALDLTSPSQVEKLLAEVTRALNYLCDAPDNKEAISNTLRNPGALTDTNLVNVRIRFGSQTQLGLRRLPRVPQTVKRYLGDKADRLEVYVKADPNIALRLNVILISRLIALRTSRLSPLFLGNYLLDVQRFLQRIVMFKQSQSGEAAEIVVSNHDGGQLSIKFSNKKLHLNHVA